jgi:hypothetical protein
MAIIGGSILCLDAAGVLKDPNNPQAWLKGGVSITISLIPGFAEAKGVVTISKAPWIIMKDSTRYIGDTWVVNNGISSLPTGFVNSVTCDWTLNQIMNYLGIPTHIY